MSEESDRSRPLAWVLERTWATVVVAVVASAAVTAALSWVLSGGPPGAVGLTISTVAAASLSSVASIQRNRHVRVLEGVQQQLRARVREVEKTPTATRWATPSWSPWRATSKAACAPTTSCSASAGRSSRC